MLTSNTRLKLQGILRRIAHQEEVGLSDRIYVQKFADHDATVASWLRTARRLQRGPADTGVDQLLTALDLGDVDGDSQAPKNPDDDLGDWFRGAPDWLRRS